MRFGRQAPTPLPAPPECHQVGAVLQAYLDGELGAKDAELVAAHLEHCERCGIEVTTITRVVQAIRRQRPDLETDTLDRLGSFVDELTGHDPKTES